MLDAAHKSFCHIKNSGHSLGLALTSLIWSGVRARPSNWHIISFWDNIVSKQFLIYIKIAFIRIPMATVLLALFWSPPAPEVNFCNSIVANCSPACCSLCVSLFRTKQVQRVFLSFLFVFCQKTQKVYDYDYMIIWLCHCQLVQISAMFLPVTDFLPWACERSICKTLDTLFWASQPRWNDSFHDHNLIYLVQYNFETSWRAA